MMLTSALPAPLTTAAISSEPFSTILEYPPVGSRAVTGSAGSEFQSMEAPAPIGTRVVSKSSVKSDSTEDPAAVV